MSLGNNVISVDHLASIKNKMNMFRRDLLTEIQTVLNEPLFNFLFCHIEHTFV